jgi:DNA-binding transcriptional MerR regulator
MNYDIAQLEKLTGVNSRTLRKWEERYGILKPDRTDSNIRIYNDAQLIRLLNITTLLDNGYKISKVAALSEVQLVKAVQEVQAVKEKDKSADYNVIIHQLIAATLCYDELAFETVIAKVIKRIGMLETMLNVLYPFFHKLGLMWLSFNATPLQEHFASNIIRRKLLVAIDGLRAPKKTAKTIILLLPPNEWHETGLLLADYLIRAKGHKTIYLGQNVPFDALKELSTQIKVNYLLTFFVARQGENSILSATIALSKLVKNIEVLIVTSLIEKEALKKYKNIHFITSPSELLSML